MRGISAKLLSRRVVFLATVVVLAACGDSGTEPGPVPVKYVVTASKVLVEAGSYIDLRAQAVDANDQPVALAGRTILWTYEGIRGSFSRNANRTGPDGSAGNTFTADTVAGRSVVIRVVDDKQVSGVSQQITTIAGPSTKYKVETPTTQPAVGSAVTITGQLSDLYGNAAPVAGRVVTWTSSVSGGSFSAPTTTTNASGVATVTYTVGPSAGVAYTIGATDNEFNTGQTPVMVSKAGAAAKYVVTPAATDPPAGSTISIQAQLTDAFGNSVHEASRLVTWSFTGSGGQLLTQTSGTDVNGIASVKFKTSSATGTTNSVTATDGTGTTGTSPSFVTQPLVSFVTLAKGLGSISSCGISTSGRAYCWGANSYGQLGNGTTVSRPVVGAVSGNLTFAALASGDGHTCGLTTGGAAYCWGDGSSGQLGNNSTEQQLVPVATAGGLTFTSITAGGFHTCGIATGGAAYCWGNNSNGRLGAGTNLAPKVTFSAQPVKVAGDKSFTSLTAGSGHTCALDAGGTAWCWGSNIYGQLGDNTESDRIGPVAVAGGLSFTSLSAGAYHTCGIASGGGAYCWGLNDYGQLGSGGFGPPKRAPVVVVGALSFTTLASGGFHNCGLVASGAAYCWGGNSEGELGNGQNQNTATPVAVSFGYPYKAISAGGNLYGGGSYYYDPVTHAHTCAITTAGVTYCWGTNADWELGQGETPTTSNVPLKVEGQP